MATAPLYYFVRRGDSVTAISRRYQVPRDRILFLNGLREPVDLEPGQKLLISLATPVGSRDRYRPATSSGLTPVSSRLPSRIRPTTPYDDGPATPGILGWPLSAKARLTSKFGPRWGSSHDGIDLAVPNGTPVLSAHSGQVVYSGNGLSGYGNLVILRHRSGLTTVYAHNRRNLVDVGDRVYRGEKVAEVGETGRTTGPHLHFEVRKRITDTKFQPVDPLPYLLSPAALRRIYGTN